MRDETGKRTGPQAPIGDAFGRPLQDLRISLLDRCNFRCPYCMPEAEFGEDYRFLTRRQMLSHDEIYRIASIAVGLGVSKLRLTGGEPLLDKKVASLVARLSKLDGVDDLALTTNGVLLPPLAQSLADAGLHRVTISLDSMDEAVFRRMSGNRGDLAKVLEGIAAAEKAGLTPIKINVVVQRGVNDHTVLDVLQHFRGSGHIVRLIEFMDVGNRNGWKLEQVVPSRDLLKAIQARWPLRAVGRNYPGEVARRYQYLDGEGEVGFISSVTEPFCGACSRARLSADGTLYTCLFATQGTNLMHPMRSGASDAELADILRNVWIKRTDRYSETRTVEPVEKPLINKVEMYRMGG
ncbi:MAG: GTP 3',8-cyclase MoaA [Woeseiaceae bacterium]|nr:GTP 3',8-cyclase MoaA [Woeseiaceae bacterium]